MKYDIHQNQMGGLNLLYSLKFKILLKKTPIFSFIISLVSCTSFVEIDPPKNILIAETVFNNSATVESALANIYYKMREGGMVSGKSGLTSLTGIYSDELDYFGFDSNRIQLYNHSVTASNAILSNWWSEGYNLIYAANDIINGVENSNSILIDDKKRYKGEALFVRAYLHSLLVELFGEIPYITSTNYIENNSVVRLSISQVYDEIIEDLIIAADLMKDLGVDKKVVPGPFAAKALLARMYLYSGKWKMANEISTEVIDNFILEQDINNVFLKNSLETIWHFKPGDIVKNTHEANELMIRIIPGSQFAITDDLLQSFEQGDLRFKNWIGVFTSDSGATTLHYPAKYKANVSVTESMEYSILLRLSEQILIRAEARAELDNLIGAQHDLNLIRNRAGLNNIQANSKNELIYAIFKERRVELFAEQGHRWFDLKRTRNASRALEILKSNWQPSHILFPIPESELELNPNLLPQNEGY